MVGYTFKARFVEPIKLGTKRQTIRAPDDFTLVPYRGKPMADSPRYKMLGNSMAVNVMQWIGGRIDLVRGVMEEGDDTD